MHRDGSPSELDDAREDAEDRAQLFKRQVRDALQAALVSTGWQEYPTHALATELAPRVAAAFDEAIYRAFDAHIDGYEVAVAQSSGREVALSALRGETP